eukprot:TRINITY_DN8695_c0_g1_i1.p1 TRINITY_DN8695_c0_g1~~TRINITY_DN8695_c0_g1_i1.p1  ORF type:complete len:392 (+),score=50.09 TRINITY_DN8695_c0_g1_i1:1181-2356(+)
MEEEEYSNSDVELEEEGEEHDIEGSDTELEEDEEEEEEDSNSSGTVSSSVQQTPTASSIVLAPPPGVPRRFPKLEEVEALFHSPLPIGVTSDGFAVFSVEMFPMLVDPKYWNVLVDNYLLCDNSWYFITSFISGSEKSAIFTAYDRRHNKSALKIAGKEEVERSAAVPKHPGIIEMYDFHPCVHSGYWSVFTMEHALYSLNHWITNDLIVKTPEKKKEFVRSMFQTMEDLHKAGFVAGDCSSNNYVIVEEEGQLRIKMIDFEITQQCVPNLGHVVMRTSEVFYTPHYVAPELIAEAKRSNLCLLKQQHDAYSVAAVAFFVLFEEAPSINTDPANPNYAQDFDDFVRLCFASGVYGVNFAPRDGDEFATLLSYNSDERISLRKALRLLERNM